MQLVSLLQHFVIALIFMTLFSEQMKKQLNDFLQEEPCTKDRSAGFRILVGLLVFVNIFLIIFCLVK